ncbi:MAG: SCO family protein [Proteobacteria bacterium]|nr:SCO family protein [Pseudomonadota bacterium]
MRILVALGLGVFLLLTNANEAAAHSLQSLENQLRDREKYFQSLDREAPDFILQDADGRTVGLSALRGKVVVLHFIYTNCPDICPLHAERIAEIQAMTNQTPMRELVRFVTITTDPKNDTPEVMRTYGRDHGLDPVNWAFLTSGPQRITATRELVERFGHKFTQEGDGYQVHGVVTHVIDMEGRWRANFHGLQFQSTNLVLFINALTNDIHGAGKSKSQGMWNKIQGMFKQ